MSAEAPKGNQGRLPGFLRRFVAGASEAPQTFQSVNTQPPPGLEGFASRIQTGIDNQLELKRQQALRECEELRAVFARGADYWAIEQRRISEEKEKEKRAAEEGARILSSLHVAERLKYIQDSVWEGKGQIKYTVGVRELFHQRSLASLELNHQYPALRTVQAHKPDYSEQGGGGEYYWKYVPDTATTCLIVDVIDVGANRGVPDTKVRVFSEVKLSDENCAKVCSVFIPVGTKTTEQELETALVQETVTRAKRDLIPPRLEERERRALAKAKRTPAWQKLVYGIYRQSPEGSLGRDLTV